VKGAIVVVGDGGWMGERGEMGEASVRVKLGSSGPAVSPFSAMELAPANSAGEGDEVTMRCRAGARLLALLRNSFGVMCSPDALRRPEKMTPELQSANAIISEAAEEDELVEVEGREVSEVCCSPRVKRADVHYMCHGE